MSREPGLWALVFGLAVFASRPFLPRAVGWVGHAILVAASYILARDQPYRDLGADSFRARHSRHHHLRRLVRRSEALGYKVNVEHEAA